MTTFKILSSSFKRRIGDSLMLSVGLAVNVLVIVTFLAVGYAPDSTLLQQAQSEIKLLFIACAFISMFFTFFFSWSVSGYFVMKRKRELATWLLLGMRKRSAFLLLLGEIFFASFAAFIIGVGGSFVLNRFFSMLLAFMMREQQPVIMPITLFTITVALLLVVTQLFFVALRILVAVKRSSLTELLNAERQNDKMVRALPLRSVLGILCISAGYIGASIPSNTYAIMLMLPVLFVTVLGTFLLFSGLVPSLVYLLRTRRTIANASLMISVAQTSFRMRRNARMLSFIATLIAVAATAAGTMFSLGGDIDAQIGRLAPNDIELSGSDKAHMDKIAIALESALDSIPNAKKRALKVIPSIKISFTYPGGEKPRIGYAFKYSDRKALLKDINKVDTTNYEREMILASGNCDYDFSKVPPKSLSLQFSKDKELLWSFTGNYVANKNALTFSSIHVSNQFFIDDALWEELALTASENEVSLRYLYCWNISQADALRDNVKQIQQTFNNKSEEHEEIIVIRSYELNYLLKNKGAMLFIGSMLAIAFLVAALSSIAFKQLEDAQDDIARYTLLRNIGMTNTVVGKTIALQVSFAFSLPLIIGITDTIFALKMLKTITMFEVIVPGIIVISIILVAFIAVANIVINKYTAIVIQS